MGHILRILSLLSVLAQVVSITIVTWKPQAQGPRPGLYWFNIPHVSSYLGEPRGYLRVAAAPVFHGQGENYRGLKSPALLINKRHRKYPKRGPPVSYPITADEKRPLHPGDDDGPGVPDPRKRPEEDFKQDASFSPAMEGESFGSFGRGNDIEIKAEKLRHRLTTPGPEEESNGTFKPIQMYFQVRKTDSVKHVPQSEAVKDAGTLEEILNAPRLKELTRTTRIREVYSEEGYEDAGYDHGGHVKHAEHDEVYAAQDEGLFKIRENTKEEDYAVPDTISTGEKTPQESKLEPKITQSRLEISKTAVEYVTLPPSYTGGHKYSSKIRGTATKGRVESAVATESSPVGKRQGLSSRTFGGFSDPVPSLGLPVTGHAAAAVNPRIDFIQVTTPRTRFIKIVSARNDPQKSGHRENGMNTPNLSGRELKLSKQRAKGDRLQSIYPRKNRFRLAKTGDLLPAVETEQQRLGTESEDNRIILPTIGYINSLTNAHFGGRNLPQTAGSNDTLKKALNITEALRYLRRKDWRVFSSKGKKDVPAKLAGMSTTAFEPMKISIVNRNRRSVSARGNTEVNGSPGGDDIAEEERRRLEENRRERESYERELRRQLEKEEEEIVEQAQGEHGPEGEVESAFQELAESEHSFVSPPDSEAFAAVDAFKYPFYFSKDLPEYSPLRYATNPTTFPRKSGAGMEFYESRYRLVSCPEMTPDLSDIPRKNTTLESESGGRTRFGELGGRIDCMKRKYFDEDPLDNPLFKENKIVTSALFGGTEGGREEHSRHSGRFEGRNYGYSVTEKVLEVKRPLGEPERNEGGNAVNRIRRKYGRDDRIEPSVKQKEIFDDEKIRIIPVTEKVEEGSYSQIRLQPYHNNAIKGLLPPTSQRAACFRCAPYSSAPSAATHIRAEQGTSRDSGSIPATAAVGNGSGNKKTIARDPNDNVQTPQMNAKQSSIDPRPSNAENTHGRPRKNLVMPSPVPEASGRVPNLGTHILPESGDALLSRKIGNYLPAERNGSHRYRRGEPKEKDAERGDVEDLGQCTNVGAAFPTCNDKILESFQTGNPRKRKRKANRKRPTEMGSDERGILIGLRPGFRGGRRGSLASTLTVGHSGEKWTPKGRYIHHSTGLEMVYVKKEGANSGVWIFGKVAAGEPTPVSRPAEKFKV